MGKYLYGTKIQMSSYGDRYKFYIVYGQYRQLHLIREEGNGKIEDIRCIDTEDLLKGKFEIIEEQEEIDIQEINLDFARLGQFSIKNAKGQEEILEVLFIEVQEKMKELARKINYLDKNIKEKQ